MNRDSVKKLLLDQAWGEVARLALDDRRVIRALLSLLYDADDFVRWLAIEAIEQVAGMLADDDPEKVRELVRRLLWNLNDENGCTPWGSAGAVGAIAARRPDLFGGYMSILYPYHEDDSLAPEIIWAVGMVGPARPELVREYIPFLLTALGNPGAVIRGYAAWAVGMLNLPEACTELKRLTGDPAPVAVYQGGGRYLRSTVADLAVDSIGRISTSDSGGRASR